MTAQDTKRESVLSKVRKMLDLAEGSDKQGEIDAALQQASKLMARHAIEQAEIDKLRDGDKPEQIIKRKVFVGSRKSPTSSSKGNLSVAVAETNRCRVYRSDSLNPDTNRYEYTLVFVGYESDVDFVEMLWTSLCLQMDTAHDSAKAFKREWVNGRTFRANFYAGFITEAWNRLREIKRETMREITDGSTGSALVLRDRETAVQEWLDSEVGKLSRSYGSNRTRDYHAAQAGRHAGARADYTGTARIGARGQIGAGS